MPDLNVVTHSLVTAAALILVGHAPTKVYRHEGRAVFVFAPTAEGTLRQYRRVKQDLDQQVGDV